MIECELLPGGRWLLTSNTKDQYLLHDLHMDSPQPRELANPGRYGHEDGTLDELLSFRVCIDNFKDDLRFRFVVWRDPYWIGKFVANLCPPGGHVTRTFIYKTNVFEDEGEYFLYHEDHILSRSYFPCRRPSAALSEKYLIEALNARAILWQYREM